MGSNKISTIDLEEPVVEALNTIDTVAEQITTVDANVDSIKGTVEANKTTLAAINTNTANVNSRLTEARAGYLDLLNDSTNGLAAIKSSISGISASVSSASGAHISRLKEIAASDTSNLFYSDVDNYLYIKHSSLGMIGYKVIGYGSDGDGYVTLMATKIATSMKYHGSTSGWTWATSAVRTWLNGTFKDGLPSSITSNIKTVSKQTNAPGSSTMSSATETIWILSYEEYIGTSGCYAVPHGDVGYNNHWWLRSPYSGNTTTAWYVDSSSGTTYNASLSGSYGLVPCFCIA